MFGARCRCAWIQWLRSIILPKGPAEIEYPLTDAMGSAASIVSRPIQEASADEVRNILEALPQDDQNKLKAAMAPKSSMGKVRFGGSHIIHWDSTRGFEGKFEGNDFVAHDGDRREVSKSDIYKLGEIWQCNDRVWAYWTGDNKYLNSGKVTAVGVEKSYVEFEDGDKGLVPNEWIHKMVRCGGGKTRFGGSHIIHWDSTRGFEGKFEGNDFVAHDGDRREVSKSDIYKLGEIWQCNDRVWAYWTGDNKYLNSGKVTAVGVEKSYVEFEDGDKGLVPNEWIHKFVTFQSNESNLENNDSNESNDNNNNNS
eukprot:Skav208272  [mRNA]  locus=scaffold188:409626:410555:- [translate_table: standard]